MKQGTIPRVELAWDKSGLPPYRPGHWIRAGTPSTEPYPCTCRYDPCRYPKCPDRYRAEGEQLPAGCCGRAGHSREADLARTGPVMVPTAAGFVTRDARTVWERRLPTAPVAGVADSELWGVAPDEAPPPWDAIDEVSGNHGETLEAGLGYAVAPAAPEADGGQAEELWRAELGRRRVAVASGHCECRTPWDVDPPSLLWAAGPKATAPDRALVLSQRPGADVRTEADQALELAGTRRLRPWKETRHALLPPADPASRVKTRACWAAPLDTGGVAVIDLPPEPRGGGVHCSDCCRDFQSRGAYELHRPRSRRGCVDPASVRLVTDVRLALCASAAGLSGSKQIDRVDYGPPMLKRTLGGIWSVDPLAVWGTDGPKMTAEQANMLWIRTQQQLAAAPRWQFGKGHNRGS